MSNITDRFIDGLYDVMHSELPPLAVQHAKMCLLDYLGVTFAGATMLTEKGNNILDFFENETGNTTVIGFGRKSTLFNAALINGMSAHIAELDDGVRQGSIHPGAPIISALLPLAEMKKLSGKDLLRGIIIGYEAAIGLASAIQPSHRNKGFHTTGTVGTIGVAMAIAAALGYSRAQFKNALSAAATSASGMLNLIKGSSELKPYNAGQAAVSGLMAALQAYAGFTGSDDVLNGEWGFLGMMSDDIKHDFLERKPGEPLRIGKVYIKPHAACRHCHPAIDATLAIRSKYGLLPEEIKSVKVTTYFMAVGGHDHTTINGITSAKMSTPFSVAVALQTGKAGIKEFSDETINDNAILGLTQKVSVSENSELSAIVPHKRPAVVEIQTINNKLFVERVDLAKGEPENPLNKKELKDKLISLGEYAGKSKNKLHQLIQYVTGIENKLDKLLNSSLN